MFYTVLVPGIIGCIQALEAIKIITKSGCKFKIKSFPNRLQFLAPLTQKLLLFDAMSPRYTIVKLRGRNPKCEICGDEPTIKELIDYVQFSQSGPRDKTPSKNILPEEEHITVEVNTINNKLVLEISSTQRNFPIFLCLKFSLKIL